MNAPRYPDPLIPGSRIAVAAPSSGASPALHRRLDRVLSPLRSQGLEAVEGQCLRQEQCSASVPATQRAAELMHFLRRDDIAACLRWAGWLQGLAGLLIGRSAAPDSTGANELRYGQALQSCLGDLTCPVLVDVDIGHRPPQLLLVNGAWAEVRWSTQHGGELTQHFN